jgi:hypothetical protein
VVSSQRLLYALIPCFAACGSVETTESSRSNLDASTLTDADLHPTCLLSEVSTLPGVRIDVTASRCVFTLAEARAGISISYDVVIEHDVPAFVPPRYPYGANVDGLYVTDVLSGGDQQYCLCDLGLPYSVCPLEDGGESFSGLSPCAAITLHQGVYHRTFLWDGVNWYGPSDTNAPKRAPFPAGDYTLAIDTSPGWIAEAGLADAAPANAVAARARFLVRLVP